MCSIHLKVAVALSCRPVVRSRDACSDLRNPESTVHRELPKTGTVQGREGRNLLQECFVDAVRSCITAAFLGMQACVTPSHLPSPGTKPNLPQKSMITDLRCPSRALLPMELCSESLTTGRDDTTCKANEVAGQVESVQSAHSQCLCRTLVQQL